MEAFGSLPVFRASIPCVVIGEDWPAWLPILPSLGARVAAVIGRTGYAEEEGEGLASAERLEVGSESARRFLSQVPRDTLLFVSGSSIFMQELAPVLMGMSRVVMALNVGNRITSRLRVLYPEMHWRCMIHAEVGGVTTARNWIGASQDIKLNEVGTSPYRRSIGEVIKPTLRGQFGKSRTAPVTLAVQAEDEKAKVLFEAPQLISPNGLWPVNYGDLKVVAPSVFAKSGWVWRTLDPLELGGAWDLPGTMVDALKRVEGGKERQSREVRAMYRTVPGKSLWTFGHAMDCFGLRVTALEDETDQEEDSMGRRGFGLLMDSLARDEGQGSYEVESDAGRRLREAKATKADDAKVPTQLWDERIWKDWTLISDRAKLSKSFDSIRELFLMRRWRQNVRRSFVDYLKKTYGQDWQDRLLEGGELGQDLQAGRDALDRGMRASWWGWDAGSSLFFWRWPKEFLKEARDGTPVRISGRLPMYRKPQQAERDPLKRTKIEEKLESVRYRGYVKPGPVVSLTSFFCVDKGPTDIRMVYDASKSGLNDVVWVPSFGLPTVDSTLRGIDSTTSLGDLDLGEMFLNFPVDHKIRPYVGLDLSGYPLKGETSRAMMSGGVSWERWERCLMGFKPSPYNATRAFAWGEEIIRGDRRDQDNPMRWERVRLNLPGEEGYTSGLPWVSKVVRLGGCDKIAGDFFTYMDDIRTCGQGDEHCWEVSRRVAALCGYLGIQDAPRKRRAPSKIPGAWAGSNVVITADGVAVTVSQEKWDKMKLMVNKWKDRLEKQEGCDHKQLESDVGFMIYVARTYPSMKPYLKGFHLTLHGWRLGRDDSGWREASLIVGRDREDWQEDEEHPPGQSGCQSEAPKLVKPVPRLRDDLNALHSLLSSEAPPLRLVRPTLTKTVRYGFGDASGSGFGSTMSSPGEVLYRHGVWGSDGEGTSSNWRELTNLVEVLEFEARKKRLCGCELFLFTDNSTAEAAFFKGTSSSEKLFLLVLRLRQLEMNEQCLLHLVHVAGTRMISQGSDGLSRGNLTEGVMRGQSMMSYVPLGKSALTREPRLEAWIRSWAGNGLEVLDPEGWFERGQGIKGYTRDGGGRNIPYFSQGTFLWNPAPAAAAIAAEELRRSRHKREDCCHVFVCPRLMTNLWRKLVLKEADFVFEVPVGCDVWKREMHEPLLIFICLPFIIHSPWKLANTPALLGLARKLRRVWAEPTGDPGSVLRELFELQRRVCTMPPKLDEGGFEWCKRGDELRYLVARDGDHLQCPFQCDLCVFRTLRGEDPGRGSSDRLLLRCIRRINLDALWAREPGTVQATRSSMIRGIALCAMVKTVPPYPALGPYPVSDAQGYGVAVQMVLASTKPGRHADYLQFDTIRQYRTAFANVHRASAVGSAKTLVWIDDKGLTKRQSVVATQSEWFERFAQGCRKRMGAIYKPDLAVTSAVMVSYLELIQERINQATEQVDIHLWTSVGAYSALCFCASLRGNEGFLLDLHGLRTYIEEGKEEVCAKPHVVAPLLGRFKNEIGERYHLVLLAPVTQSGLRMRYWLEQLVEVRAREGRTRGPAFCDAVGKMVYSGVYESRFFEILTEIQGTNKELIPESVEVAEDYGIGRSFRRGSDSEAIARGVDSSDIDAMNRWRIVERARGRRPVFSSMREHYADVRIMALDRALRYSSVL